MPFWTLGGLVSDGILVSNWIRRPEPKSSSKPAETNARKSSKRGAQKSCRNHGILYDYFSKNPFVDFLGVPFSTLGALISAAILESKWVRRPQAKPSSKLAEASARKPPKRGVGSKIAQKSWGITYSYFSKSPLVFRWFYRTAILNAWCPNFRCHSGVKIDPTAKTKNPDSNQQKIMAGSRQNGGWFENRAKNMGDRSNKLALNFLNWIDFFFFAKRHSEFFELNWAFFCPRKDAPDFFESTFFLLFKKSSEFFELNCKMGLRAL